MERDALSGASAASDGLETGAWTSSQRRTSSTLPAATAACRGRTLSAVAGVTGGICSSVSWETFELGSELRALVGFPQLRREGREGEGLVSGGAGRNEAPVLLNRPSGGRGGEVGGKGAGWGWE